MTDVLRKALETSVPLWIERVKRWPVQYREQRTRVCSYAIELAMKGGKDPSHPVLAEGLALMSMMPGGVEFAGMKWETLPWTETAVLESA